MAVNAPKLYASKTSAQHNDPNMILVSYREEIRLLVEVRPAEYLLFCDLWDWGPLVTEEHKAHARKVLSRLAALETQAIPAPEPTRPEEHPVTIKTPREIAIEHATIIAKGDASISMSPEALAEFLRCAIEADRAQRQPEIYIVQNEPGDVVDVFRDADEATAAYQEGYTVIEETIWEPGEYAAAQTMMSQS
ncbi:hypothetical protein [Microbacterium sp. 77mftsu3.1]|uniref:hypothetical protein n=1 Tax=Microbacterium sp. 77mftsu3.1 TaxID=1761802 RepID=UPI00115FC773|nr:hypothetical protein [Microbacterium sp. 77mftsu3.1]